MKVASYARVSGKRQAGDRWSLPAQREAIERRCAAESWPAPTWYIEAHSAKDDDPDARPVFRQLLADAYARAFDTLLIVDVDRFARSVVAGLDAAARLERAGVRVVSLNDGDIDTADPDGEFSFTLKLMLARRENRVRGRRSKVGMDAARAAGKHVNLPPYGAVIGPDGRLALDPATSPVLARILREAATQTPEAIAARLTDERIPPPGTRRVATRWGPPSAFWWPNAIRFMVKHGAWLAALPAPWPALWYAASARRPAAHARRDARTHLLTGLARCACGGRLLYSRGRGGRHWFCCRNIARGGTGHGCQERHAPAATHEAHVLAAIAALPPPVEETAEVEAHDPAAWLALAEDRRRLDHRYKHRLIDDAQLAAELAELARREASLPRGDAAIVQLRTEVAPLVAIFDTLDAAERNAVLRYLVEAVILEGKQTRLCWKPEAVRAFGLTGRE